MRKNIEFYRTKDFLDFICILKANPSSLKCEDFVKALNFFDCSVLAHKNYSLYFLCCIYMDLFPDDSKNVLSFSFDSMSSKIRSHLFKCFNKFIDDEGSFNVASDKFVFSINFLLKGGE